MNARPALEHGWTPDEYLAWERLQTDKHEFFGGEVFGMAGATFAHNQIVANVLGELRAALRQKPCRVSASDLRVKVPAIGHDGGDPQTLGPAGLYTYPDASVVCGRPVFEDDKLDTLQNPLVLVEVLSPSTEDYDRGTKFTNYRTIPSFRDYVLVSTDKVLVEYATRTDDGAWLLRDFKAGERIAIASIGIDLVVDELYLKVFDVLPGEAP